VAHRQLSNGILLLTSFTKRRRERRGFLGALGGTRGAIDLASIMVGVLVIGIVGGVVSASVITVVPWAQDSAAKSAVGAVQTAESVSRVRDKEYVSFEQLVKVSKLIQDSKNVTAGTNNAQTCFVAVSRSDTGTIFYGTDKSRDVLTYVAGTSKTDDCLDLDSLVASLPMRDGDAIAQSEILNAVAVTAHGSTNAGGAVAIELGHVDSALSNVRATYPSKTTAWTAKYGNEVPTTVNEFSTRFEGGVPTTFGQRAAVVTVGNANLPYVGVVFDLAGNKVVCNLSADYSTPDSLLAAVGGDWLCPDPSSAITSMWAWGNSVDPAADTRGENLAGMKPAAVASFAKARGLSTVYLNAPWASNQGEIGVWLDATVDALHAEHIKVGALGGGTDWLETPGLVTQWITDAKAAADFDSVQLDVEPWAGSGGVDADTYVPKLMTLLDEAQAASGDTRVGMDVPYWLATEPYNGGLIIDTLLPDLDTVAIVTFRDHAAGPEGIVALSTAAVQHVTAAGKPFTIGVETDTAAKAGGGQYTFNEEGSAALEAETKLVRSAFKHLNGYAGVTVQHKLTWEGLRP
jgi:hypothetical protein